MKLETRLEPTKPRILSYPPREWMTIFIALLNVWGRKATRAGLYHKLPANEHWCIRRMLSATTRVRWRIRMLCKCSSAGRNRNPEEKSSKKQKRNLFSLLEEPEEGRHRADVERVRRHAEYVVQQATDLAEQGCQHAQIQCRQYYELMQLKVFS